jgi:glycosyltransferase involved in cell wall biosynthesis
VLKVALDTSPLTLSRAGTARYVHALEQGLDGDPDVDLQRLSFGGRGRTAVLVRDVGWYLGSLSKQASREGASVLHCPTFRAPIRSRVPLVVTFHDLAVLRHAETFNAWTRAYSRMLLPRVARAASRLIAVSEFTAQELVDLLDAPAAKIRVIPNGVGDPFTATGEAAGGDYVLAVSTLEPRKNIETLVEAFRRSDLNGCELRIVGALGWGDVRVDGDDRVRWLGEVSDEELARLYRGARCAAYLSLYEGFGLPVLEAMACGTPVVASDLAPIREFGQGVPVRVDPRDSAAVAAGLAEAVARGEELGRRGPPAAAAYEWRRTVRETLAVYRELAE